MVFSEAADNFDQSMMILCGPGGVAYLWKGYNQSKFHKMDPVNGVNSHFFRYSSGTAYCKIRTSKIMTLDEEKEIQYDFSQARHFHANGFLFDKKKIRSFKD